MFSYYGTKSKISSLYPKPIFGKIIEPFAGAAGYSCLYPNNNVILYDKNPKICSIWNFLINATSSDISNLPDVDIGQSLNDFNQLSESEKWLIGFCINPASSSPKITASKRNAWSRYKVKLINFVPMIKHWVIHNESFDNIENTSADWFIDPPYQSAGKYYYGHSNIDFIYLGVWCMTRKGQIIICENDDATWLDFKPLVNHQGMIKKRVEVIKHFLSDEL